MSKSKASDNFVRVERWNVASDKGAADPRRDVAKVAVRNSKGQFRSATNFRGSVLG